MIFYPIMCNISKILFLTTYLILLLNHVSARRMPQADLFSTYKFSGRRFMWMTTVIEPSEGVANVVHQVEVISPTSLVAAAALFEQGHQHDVFIPSIAESPSMNNNSNTTSNFNWKKNMPWLFIVVMLFSGGLSFHYYYNSSQPSPAAVAPHSGLAHAPAPAPALATDPAPGIELISASNSIAVAIPTT